MSTHQKVSRLRTLAKFMDSKFEAPGGFRFGFDALIGFVPVFGDLATTLVSFYILMEAATLGCHPAVIVRMGLNIAIEALMSSVPVLGNLFDFWWQSNTRNLKLIESHLAQPRATAKKSFLVLMLVFLTLVTLVVAAGAATFLILSKIFFWLSQT